jgi:hypothetical protein
MKILNKLKSKLAKAKRKNNRKKNWDLYSKILINNGFIISREDVTVKADIYYLMESPELLTKVGNIDFNHANLDGAIVFASFDRPNGSKARKWINTTVDNHLLSDKFCEMPESLDIKNIKNKAIISRSQKEYLSGHKLRHKIYPSKNIDILELDGTIENTNAIYKQYKYMIVIENSITPGYVTEKFFDAIKCGCAILYMGDYEKVKSLGYKNIYKLNDIYEVEELTRKLIDEESWSEEVAIQNFNNLIKMREDSLDKFLSFPSYHLYMETKYEDN